MMLSSLTDDQLHWLQERFPFSKQKILPVFGSHRSFFRLFGDEETRIVIVDDNDEQFHLYLDRTKLFESLEVSVPRMDDYSEQFHLILVEDLGDCSLERIVYDTDDYIPYYEAVIDSLVNWQKRFDAHPQSSSNLPLKPYDVSFARNETRYFTVRFLQQFSHLFGKRSAFLDPFLDELAQQTSQLPQTLMHRDFQSQNIHWHNDKPCFVDFQAAVRGPYTYDLTSLVYDNYVELTAEQKGSLIDYFYQSYPDRSGSDFYPAALQRTFQALGAYAFLILVQGKDQYRRYIPRGIAHLKELATHFPWLDRCIDLLREI